MSVKISFWDPCSMPHTCWRENLWVFDKFVEQVIATVTESSSIHRQACWVLLASFYMHKALKYSTAIPLSFKTNKQYFSAEACTAFTKTSVVNSAVFWVWSILMLWHLFYYGRWLCTVRAAHGMWNSVALYKKMFRQCIMNLYSIKSFKVFFSFSRELSAGCQLPD